MAQKKTAKFKKLQRQVNEILKNLVIPAGQDRKEYIAKTLAPPMYISVQLQQSEGPPRGIK